MIEIHNKANCVGCEACVNACPKQCITLSADDEGFCYPSVNAQQCIHCGACVKACPMAQEVERHAGAVRAFAAMNKDEPQRLESSSGGVFSVLSEHILEQGGVVFGAAFSDDFKAVHHIAVQSREELWRLRGAKYVQSSIGQAYSQAKAFLCQGRTVLFTGTPCQIGGLHAYLGKQYEQLYTQSVICHGVPSPQIWKAYAAYREKEAGAALTNVSFRDKTPSWTQYRLVADFSGDMRYQCVASEDPYMRCFVNDYILRPSCYHCHFKSNGDKSDLSLADFWGIHRVAPEMYDEKGVSLVLVRTKRGQRLLETVSPKLKTMEVDWKQAVLENPAAVQSVKMPRKRKRLMKDLRTESIPKVLLRYSRDTAFSKISGRLRWYQTKLKRMLNK